MFEKAKTNYERGYWTKEMLEKLVEKKFLTEEEYKKIVGE